MLATGCGASRLVKVAPDGGTPKEKAVPSGTLAMTLEGQDERLSAVVLALGVAPRAGTHRQDAIE